MYSWDFIINKSYQAQDVVSSAVTTKVKGQGFLPLNLTKDKFLNRKDLPLDKQYGLDPNTQYVMFDTGDYVIPANEYNSIFIMTNFVKTKQTQSQCDEVKQSVIDIFLKIVSILSLIFL
jgi:hypothetical protein